MRTSVPIVIITGLSGSGKTTALKVFEDIGFFCIDNLPITLMDKLIELCYSSRGEITKVALGMDVRGGSSFGELPHIIEKASTLGANIRVVFLDCADEALARRYIETRRRHPLSPAGMPIEGITAERALLKELHSMADFIIDTTSLSVHQLRNILSERFSETNNGATMTLRLLSFGYKYGIPFDSDIVLDVRFLPNPFFVDDMKMLTGEDVKVHDYVLSFEETRQFLKKCTELIQYVLPLYRREGKSYLTIAVGCTGGRHRSVAVVKEIEKRLTLEGVTLKIFNRDIERG